MEESILLDREDTFVGDDHDVEIIIGPQRPADHPHDEEPCEEEESLPKERGAAPCDDGGHGKGEEVKCEEEHDRNEEAGDYQEEVAQEYKPMFAHDAEYSFVGVDLDHKNTGSSE